ncbi:putative toxin-antitoxin system toxin component, PIN family [Rhodoferax sp.]|uniref:putative toxin-antitoxin system toxin component, PIN family n=1 Tax=Rhodoferax sp. TaxID=50421 RepID=UPI001ECDBEB5|nr:putative toxin-antitoxin system toxin component, PIN family [Rhodoferax sp.]MBT9506417.1 putative toxin-antitoxin system toxin component, PIN family [Rhodoferax sp.]
MIVLDTNIVLDTFVFNDPATQPLKLALVSRQIQWMATQPMRDELERVLTYPKILARMNFYQLVAADVLCQLDGLARMVDVAAKASVTCTDPDDQKFIDLAVALKAPLLSKDRAVLCMAKRLLALEVRACSAIDFAV